MSLLTIRDLSISIKGRPLLENADLSVDPGRRIGLIGRNGAGKSTLLRAIVGDLIPDGGDIRLAARARMGAVAQEAPGGDLTPLGVVLAADRERTDLLAEAEAANTDPVRLAEVHERLRTIGAESAPARAGAILGGLGFSREKQDAPMSSFSGGWRMRVALAAALFGNPALLLLVHGSARLVEHHIKVRVTRPLLVLHELAVEGQLKDVLAVLVDVSPRVHDEDVAGLEHEQGQLIVEVTAIFAAPARILN